VNGVKCDLREGHAEMTISSEEHRRKAHARGPVRVGIVTVSDSRSVASDENGAYLRGAIEAAGHEVAGYRVVRDEPTEVLEALDELCVTARVVLLNGGTGLSARDRTYDALAGRLERTLPGFGEIFRMLSFEQVGAAAMLSRAVAGTYRSSVVFSTPGSPAAVRLAWERLIAPELEHIAWEVGR
jgi:molybdopterin adenylyltransferase